MWLRTVWRTRECDLETQHGTTLYALELAQHACFGACLPGLVPCAVHSAHLRTPFLRLCLQLLQAWELFRHCALPAPAGGGCPCHARSHCGGGAADFLNRQQPSWHSTCWKACIEGIDQQGRPKDGAGGENKRAASLLFTGLCEELAAGFSVRSGVPMKREGPSLLSASLILVLGAVLQAAGP